MLRFTGKLERKGDFWQGERSLTRCASRSPLSAAHTSKHPHSKEHPGLQLSRHPEAEVQAGGRPWVPCVTVLAPRGLVPSWAELAGVGGGMRQECSRGTEGCLPATLQSGTRGGR